MTIVSYAQNFEDVILWRALKQVKRGFYIDIGAHDPVDNSVSLAFYEQGWRGVHVEPVKHYADRLRVARPDEQVVEAAIGRQEGTIPFFEIVDTGLSTGDELIAQEHGASGRTVKRIEVPCFQLSSILDAHRDRDIHWLKIDVEGMEDQVIRNWSPSPARPWIVLVECTKPNSPEPNFTGWEPQLLALGYDFVYFDGLNRFYVYREHPELRASFGAGPNVFDAFVLSGRANAPFCGKLNEDLAALRRQFSERVGEVVSLTQRITESEARCAEQAREAERLSAEAHLNADELAAREVEISRLKSCVAEMETQKHLATAREETLTQQITALQAALAAIHRSTSWRVTMPMRITAKFLKRRTRVTSGAPAATTTRPPARPSEERVARNVVIFTTYPLVAPRHGGQVRCAQIAKALRASGLHVTTTSVVDIGAYSTDPLGSRDIPFPINSPYRLFRGEHVPYANDYFSGQYAASDDDAYNRVLAGVPRNVDIAFLEQPWMLPVLRRLRSDRKIDFVVYDAQNNETSLKRSILNQVRADLRSALLEAIEKQEKSACSEADLVFAVNGADRAALSTYCNKQILLAPNGVEPWQAAPEDHARWKQVFDIDVSRFGLYVASAHPPNFKSFFHVFNNALGFLSPDQAICIAGGASGPIAQMLAGQRYEGLNRSRLRFLGHLVNADLAAIKQLAHAFVLPIIEGSGSNLKTAEAIFSRAWVVGTPVSFRGFEDFTSLPTVIVANPGREFQDAVRHAMGQPKPSLDKEARQRLQALTWEQTLKPMIELINQGQWARHQPNAKPSSLEAKK